MNPKTALLEGNCGLKSGNLAPDFTPERLPALHFAYRRVPSVLRVANPESLVYFPPMTEDEAFASVRFWLDPARRAKIRRPASPAEPEHAQKLQEWVCRPENKGLMSWWTKPDAWRSPREFWGYGAGMENMGLPHVEPYEVAHFRLPDDISCDADVVLFQAWCQGWAFKAWQRGRKKVEGEDPHPITKDYAMAIRNGLQKFCRSPYVRFALAAPYMNGAGIQFTGASLFDSAVRMEYLVTSPFMATDQELHCILTSPVYDVAFRRARAARRKGQVINPPGGWYAGNAIPRALGAHFRRGGLQPSRLGG